MQSRAINDNYNILYTKSYFPLPECEKMNSATFGPNLVFKLVTYKSIPKNRGKESRMEMPQMATKHNIVVNNFGVFLLAVVEYTITLYLHINKNDVKV